jgi:iron complex outermembrane recepter protein
MGGRESWMQYVLNPWQRGYGCAYQTVLNSPFCTAISGSPLPANGVVGAAAPSQSPSEVGFHRRNERDIVGLRYEHDFDSLTTWRARAMYDLLDVEQPNVPTQTVVGPTAAVNAHTDITSHAPIFGSQATHYLDFFYNNAHLTQNAYWVVPFAFNQGGTGALKTLQSNFQSDMGFKAREEIAFSKQLTGVVGFSSTWSKIWGFSDAINYVTPVLQAQPTDISAAHSYWNYAPEATLTYRYSPEWQLRARYETAHATPAPTALFYTSTGNPGDNTNLKPQTSQGGDVGVDWTPAGWNLQASLTYFHEWWRNQFLTQTAANGTCYTTNIPSSIHRGVEANLEWRPTSGPYEGWKVIGNYTFNNQFFTNLTDMVNATGSATTILPIQRAGLRLPGVPEHQLTGRIGYDQPYGILKGVGGFVEYQYRSDYAMDNANLLWAPGFGIVNVDLHYNRDIEDSWLKKFTIHLDVKNIFDRTYISSVTIIPD